MTDLPDPPVPADCDLRHYKYIPLQIDRLRRSKSWLIAKRKPDLAFYMINLWIASWHELPAGSLEDDDDTLAELAMCDIRRFSRIKGEVLRGWYKCSDGRLYHHVVAELANEAVKTRKNLSCWGSQGAAKRWLGYGQATDRPMAENGKEIEEKESTPQTPQGGPSRKRRGEVERTPPAEDRWPQRLRGWVKGYRWDPNNGPEPDQPGCWAPAELVKAAIEERRSSRKLNGAAA